MVPQLPLIDFESILSVLDPCQCLWGQLFSFADPRLEKIKKLEDNMFSNSNFRYDAKIFR